MVPWSAVSRCHKKKYNSEGPLKKMVPKSYLFYKSYVSFWKV